MNRSKKQRAKSSRATVITVTAILTVAVLLIAALTVALILSDEKSGNTPETSANNNTEPSPEKPLTYEEYNALSGEEQEAYFNTFPSIEAFFEWYNLAKDQYEKDHPAIEIDPDSTIDLGDIVGGT